MELLKFQNKQYASEILAIILQKDEENRKKLIELGGMDTLLEVLAVYRKLFYLYQITKPYSWKAKA